MYDVYVSVSVSVMCAPNKNVSTRLRMYRSVIRKLRFGVTKTSLLQPVRARACFQIITIWQSWVGFRDCE